MLTGDGIAGEIATAYMDVECPFWLRPPLRRKACRQVARAMRRADVEGPLYFVLRYSPVRGVVRIEAYGAEGGAAYARRRREHLGPDRMREGWDW